MPRARTCSPRMRASRKRLKIGVVESRIEASVAGMNRTPVLTNSLYYRVPDIAAVEVSYGAKVLIHDRIPVYQYGAVLGLPLMLGDESTQ